MPESDTPSKADASSSQEMTRSAFDELVDSITYEVLRAAPEMATVWALDESAMGGPYNGRLADRGGRERKILRSLTASALARLNAVDASPLNDAQRLTRAVLIELVSASVAADAAANGWGSLKFDGFMPYPINQISGIHIELPRLMAVQQPVTDASQAAMYVERLNGFGQAFDQEIEGIWSDRAVGVAPPSFVIEKTLAAITRFTSDPVTENVLYTAFANKLDAAGIPNANVHLEAAQTAVANVVYPAYDRLAATLKELAQSATNEPGIDRLPRGALVYRALIRLGADSDLSAGTIHRLGLEEVDRISTELDSILTRVGRTEGSVGERLRALAEEPDLVRPNTTEGKAQIVADLNRQLEAVEPLLADWFGRVPPQRVEVRRVPPFSETSASSGYYNTPSLDGSRPGIYWINLCDTAMQPNWHTKTVTYHEAIPGHHLERALALNRRDLPLARKIWGSTTAFSEGWALYAERLAKEMGLYDDDPLGDVGRLRAELWRAVRLVVDTGIHAKGWSREQAINYVIDAGGMNAHMAEHEVDRYVVWPGQALGFKIGQLKLLELRARAEAELGDAFDIRAFHDAVLLDGGLPLPVLEMQIEQWIHTHRAP